MGWYDFNGYGYRPYVPVAQRRANALREIAKRFKNGKKASPVSIEGRKITKTFWGNAWCKNLENYSDYANRLPRGQTYVRNGSVVHLEISKGQIKALVSGSELYEVEIEISTLPRDPWQALKAQSAGKIGTLVELLQGKLSGSIMELVTGERYGLFPKPKELRMDCSCPDGAGMCKHIAAVMYGVGSRLDTKPELLFELRGVDHLELIGQAIPVSPVGVSAGATDRKHALAASDLGDIFGIELGDGSPDPEELKPARVSKRSQKPAARKKAAVTKKSSAKPTASKTATKQKPDKALTSAAAKTVRQKTTRATVKPEPAVTTIPATKAAKKPTRGKTQPVAEAAVMATVKRPASKTAKHQPTESKPGASAKKGAKKG